MGLGSLLIRADASVAMGTGHIMRCLALAQAWQDAGGVPIVAAAQATPAVKDRIRTEQIALACLDVTPGSREDSEALLQLAAKEHPHALVVDGYHFGSGYQQRLKNAGCKLLVVDDNAEAGRYYSDIVLNQNLHASANLYPQREAYTRLLLGTRYAMLRREFKTWQEWKRTIQPRAAKVLVMMGGSDAENLTQRVLEALASLQEPFEARIVIGGSNPHRQSLEKCCPPHGRVSLVQDPQSLPELMAEADLAISAAGSTCWEMCFLGLPAIVFDIAPNQAALAAELGRRGAVVYLGSFQHLAKERLLSTLNELIASPAKRIELNSRARALVDGRGGSRVVAALRFIGVQLRRAEERDCRTYWDWVNDPEVRAASFSSSSISMETHNTWFARKINDPNCLLLVAIDDHGTPLGQVRFDPVREGEFEVDVSVAPGRRGSGFGAWLIARSIDEASLSRSMRKVHALIKPENLASVRAFLECGFRNVGLDRRGDSDAAHYVYELPATVSIHD